MTSFPAGKLKILHLILHSIQHICYNFVILINVFRPNFRVLVSFQSTAWSLSSHPVVLLRRRLISSCIILWKQGWWIYSEIDRSSGLKFSRRTATRWVCPHTFLLFRCFSQSLSSWRLTFYCCRCGDKARRGGIRAASQSYWRGVQKVNAFI